MNARGFSLIELLVAAALVAAITGVLITIAAPARGALDRSLQGIELESGARAALDHITADLREAGSDAAVAPMASPLARVLPTLVLSQDLGFAVASQPATAVAVRRVPRVAAQARLSADIAAGDTLLPVETASACFSGNPACGFRQGQSAVLYADFGSEVVTIGSTGQGSVVLTGPIGAAFPAGAVLSEVVTTAYGLRESPQGVGRLVRLTDGGAEQPLIDNVVAFEVVADAADLTRARRVSIRLRVQAAASDMRGPAGSLFARPGTAVNATRWLPDVELRVDVALRNRGGLR